MVHDCAFVLESAPDSSINKILNDVGLFKKKFIGINVSILLFHLFKKYKKNYTKLIAEFICWLKNKYNCSILLIPHQIFPANYKYTREEYISSGGDDRHAIEKVLNRISDKQGIYHLSNYYSPSELKGVIKRSEIFIGGRMHAVIGAISQCIPSLIMGYSHKASGMMKMLKMEEFVWSISDEEENLKVNVQKLWKEREILKSELNKKIPSILSEIYALGEDIEAILKL